MCNSALESRISISPKKCVGKHVESKIQFDCYVIKCFFCSATVVVTGGKYMSDPM